MSREAVPSFVPASTTGHAERLKTLMEIARAINGSIDRDEVVERVLDGAVRFSGAERGFLFLSEEGRLVPWTRGRRGAPSVDVSHSVAEEVARTGRTVHRDHLAGPTGRSVSDSIVRLRLQVILCLPLLAGPDVLGVVYLDSRRPLPHEALDLELLEALTGLAAVAIENSRLVEERVRTERTLAIGQMARAMVHDLRSPLTSIRALADLLHGRCVENDPARRHLATIMAEVDRLSDITGDLLRFARQAPPLERADARLVDILEETLRPLRPRLETARVTVELQTDGTSRAHVDAPRLVRALHNLIANSLEAMPDGGTLRLACGSRGDEVLLRVSDTGIGMPEEVRLRIFEPFFTHGKAHGTGLGLAIVRAIVEEHGGRITVQSAPGRGTSFEISLPSSGSVPSAVRSAR